MIQDWKLTSGALACSRCNCEFKVGQVFFSALSEEANGGLVRQDFCTGCWREAVEDGFFCFWKTRRAAERRAVKIDVYPVYRLFAGLRDDGTAEKRELRFVLALYLTRRKALRMVGLSRRNGRELLEFQRPRAEETFRVENPRLNEDQVKAATRRLQELFQGAL